MDDAAALAELNDRFIAACRSGSWRELQAVLSDRFRYVDGTTGELWDMPRYIAEHEAGAHPALEVDQVVVHVAGQTAGVSARTSSGHRYLDVYAREPGGWRCVQACVWPDSDAD